MENRIIGQGLVSAVKKLLSLLLAIAMLLSITAGSSLCAYAETIEDYEYFILEDGTLEIEAYSGTEKNLIVPSTINGYAVTSIGFQAFADNQDLAAIHIPDSVKTLSGNSFYGCIALTDITVDADSKYYTSVNGTLYNKTKTELIKYAGAKTETSFTIPNSVTKIDSFAFDSALNLKNISIPNTITVIEDFAFANSGYYNNEENWLNGVLYIGNYLLVADEDAISGACSIKNGTTMIANSAFEYCQSLTDVTIPNSVTSIGDYAFYGCDSLTSAVIPNSVTSLGDCIFTGCGSLVSVTIPNSVNSIGEYQFAVCTELTDIKIPSNIKTIGLGAFYGCESLTNVVIPNSVTSIGDEAFATCIRLTNITIPNSVKSIGEYAFAVCSKLTSVTIPNSVKTIEDVTFYGCEGLKSITIPGSVTSIGEEAFADCTKLVSVTIPDSVTNIEDYAFDGCLNLKSVTISNKNTTIGNGSIPKSATIQGYKNSTAETYAKENGINFAAVDGECLHVWDNGRITKAAACTADGVKTYTCTKCNTAKTEAIPAAGHSYDNGTVTKKATCTATGVKTFTCTKCKATKTESIAKKAHTYKTTTTKATTSKNGSIVTKCSVCGTKKSTTTIYYPKTITLSATSYTYDGKVKKPSVTVKDSKGKKIASSNYTVTYASGRKAVGTYKVTIKFKGNYSGTVTKTFTIKPKATTLSSVTAKSKGFTVKWKKLTTQTTGYQIQYSTSSKFSSAKTVTVSKNSTTSKTVSKLTAKKKYYVRIRTYKTVGKTKIYSAWSSYKTVTTKK